MNTRILVLLVLGVMAIVGLAYVILSSDIKNQGQQRIPKTLWAKETNQNTSATSVSTTSTVPVTVMTAGREPLVATLATNVPTTTLPIPTAVISPVRAYTKAMVATHDGEASCWSIINGGVYDLTSFVPKHPGGDRNILKICGIDGTSAFMGQHGGQSQPETTLAKLYLGALTN